MSGASFAPMHFEAAFRASTGRRGVDRAHSATYRVVLRGAFCARGGSSQTAAGGRHRRTPQLNRNWVRPRMRHCVPSPAHSRSRRSTPWRSLARNPDAATPAPEAPIASLRTCRSASCTSRPAGVAAGSESWGISCPAPARSRSRTVATGAVPTTWRRTAALLAFATWLASCVGYARASTCSEQSFFLSC